MLERDAGNHSLARELFKCAVKADPKSEPSWLVSAAARADVPPCHGLRRRLCRCLHGGWARLDGACLRALREGLNKACPAPPPPPGPGVGPDGGGPGLLPARHGAAQLLDAGKGRAGWAGVPHWAGVLQAGPARAPHGGMAAIPALASQPALAVCALGAPSAAGHHPPMPVTQHPACQTLLSPLLSPPCCPLCLPPPPLQERVEVVKPANFSTSAAAAGGSAGLLAPIFTQIASWFQRYEAESSRDEPELPGMLTLLDEVEGGSGSGSGSSNGNGSSSDGAEADSGAGGAAAVPAAAQSAAVR